MNTQTDIISRMEAAQQRFGEMPPDERARRNKFASEIAIALHTETKPRLQLTDTPPESERQILRCAPPFDAQAEHEKDLEYESRVDYESWQYDGPAEREDE